MLRRFGLGSRLLSLRQLLPVQENLSISSSELFGRAYATAESTAQQQAVLGTGKKSTGSAVSLRDSGIFAKVNQHNNIRWYGSVSPGADLAQRILSADDPENLGGVVSYLATLPAAGLPSVARAAATAEIKDRKFLDSLVERTVKVIKELSPVDLCNIVESFSELGCYSIGFKDAASDHILENVDSFSGDMLGHTLRSFAKSGYYDDELLEGILTHMAANQDKFSAENVADVVYAFSKCGFCHPDLVTLVEKAGELLLEEALHDNGESIASIIDAYSRVGCSESDIVEELILKVTENPSMVSVDALAKTLTASIRLGSEDQKMLNAIIDSIVSRLENLSPEHVVNTVKSLGELGLRHDKFLDAVMDTTLPERVREFDKDDLQDILNSMNKLGYYSKSLIQILEEKR